MAHMVLLMVSLVLALFIAHACLGRLSSMLSSGQYLVLGHVCRGRAQSEPRIIFSVPESAGCVRPSCRLVSFILLRDWVPWPLVLVAAAASAATSWPVGVPVSITRVSSWPWRAGVWAPRLRGTRAHEHARAGGIHLELVMAAALVIALRGRVPHQRFAGGRHAG